MVKVLFVDDEVLLCLGAEASLTARGYEVALAFDGEEALATASHFDPDIILTDFMMPKLDGAGLAHGLVSQGISVPVVLLTAVPESDLPSDVRSKFAAYLGKPLRDEDMLPCIAALIRMATQS